MKKWRILTSFLVVFILAGCVFGETKKLTLEECVEMALEQNPGMIQAAFTEEMADKDLIVARSSFMPRVSGSVSYDHSVLGPSSALRIDPQTGIPVPLQPSEIVSWNSSARVNISQAIFNGGYNIYNYKYQNSRKNSAEHNFEDFRQSTIYHVKERYYNLLKAEKLLEVQEENVRLSEESFKRSETLFEVGKAPKSDMLQARYEFENNRLYLIEARNSLSIAKASLNHILGRDMDEEIELVDNLEVQEMEVEYNDVLDNALAKHPLLLKNTFDLKAAKNQIGMAVSSFVPSLSAYYGYSWRNEDFNKINDALDTDYSWYLGASVSIPIFQGFSRVATLNKAQLNYRSQKELMLQAKRDIEFEVKQAYFEVQQAKKKIAVSRNSEEVADEYLRLNQEKYNLGAGTMLDLVNAQVSYAEARSSRIQALYDYKYAIARLQKAMGQLDK